MSETRALVGGLRGEGLTREGRVETDTVFGIAICGLGSFSLIVDQ